MADQAPCPTNLQFRMTHTVFHPTKNKHGSLWTCMSELQPRLPKSLKTKGDLLKKIPENFSFRNQAVHLTESKQRKKQLSACGHENSNASTQYMGMSTVPLESTRWSSVMSSKNDILVILFSLFLNMRNKFIQTRSYKYNNFSWHRKARRKLTSKSILSYPKEGGTWHTCHRPVVAKFWGRTLWTVFHDRFLWTTCYHHQVLMKITRNWFPLWTSFECVCTVSRTALGMIVFNGQNNIADMFNMGLKI